MHTRYTMRQTVLMLVMGAGLLGGLGCDRSEISTCQLSGDNEVPAVSTNAAGNATATLTGDELSVQGTFSGLQSDLNPVAGTPAHIHQAAAGASGDVVFGLTVSGGDQRGGNFSGKKTLNDAQKDAFRKGLFYVNIHSVNHPGGEIRGQFSKID